MQSIQELGMQKAWIMCEKSLPTKTQFSKTYRRVIYGKGHAAGMRLGLAPLSLTLQAPTIYDLRLLGEQPAV